jgi:hypothetical protein
MDSRLSHQIAAVRIAEAHAQIAAVRAARDARGARPARAPRRVPAVIAARLAHR